MEPWDFLEAQFDRHWHTKAPANREKKKNDRDPVQKSCPPSAKGQDCTRFNGEKRRIQNSPEIQLTFLLCLTIVNSVSHSHITQVLKANDHMCQPKNT